MTVKKIDLSQRELAQHISQHLGHLLKSARDFDLGDMSEAFRMAVTLRVLLHTHRQSKAGILNLQGTKWRFLDTNTRFSSGNLAPHVGLASLQFHGNGTIQYVPRLDESSTSRGYPFPEWWDIDTVLSNIKRQRFTRKWVVLNVANQEGAHIDLAHEVDYHELNSGVGAGWFLPKGDQLTPIPGMLRTYIRQIAHETLRTFRKQASHLVPLGLYPMYDQAAPFPKRRPVGH